MSQGQQSRRPEGQETQQPIKYGDVFPHISGELALQPVNPQDAAMMQTAENLVFGKTKKRGPAAVMQSAATRNELAGLVGHNEVGRVPASEGVSVTETDLPGQMVVTETVGGQVVGEYRMPAPIPTTTPAGTLNKEALTIGEALEASAISAGDKPVDQSDAAAIQAAEIRATGMNVTVPGGVASAAQSAADANARIARHEDKTKIRDVLKDATSKLPADKAVTREDAERVVSAEIRNKPDMTTHPAGVAASVAAAARLNQSGEGRMIG